MNSVYIIAFFLLSASFCTAIQERSRGAAKWEAVQSGTHTYLALLKVNDKPVCSGSIPSKWTVLTSYAEVNNDSNTKAYSGMLKVNEATSSQAEVREVKAVAANAKMEEMKICILKEAWPDKVGFVGLPPKDGSVNTGTVCNALGFGTIPSARSSRGEQVARILKATITAAGDCDDINESLLGTKVTTENNEKLDNLDYGGPLVCDDKQYGINKIYNAAADANKKCNLYIAIAPHRDWIDQQIKAAEAGQSGEPVGTNETNANTTSPSSGCSIHSYLNKYSNWKVLLLCLTAIKFLVY